MMTRRASELTPSQLARRRKIVAIISLAIALGGLLGLLLLSIYRQRLVSDYGALPLIAFGSLWVIGLVLGAYGAALGQGRNRVAIGAMTLNAINLLMLLGLVIDLMRGYLS